MDHNSRDIIYINIARDSFSISSNIIFNINLKYLLKIWWRGIKKYPPPYYIFCEEKNRYE